MLISSPRWACLGVEGKGSATFIYALIREDEQRSEAPLSSAFPPGNRPGLLLSFLPTRVGSKDWVPGHLVSTTCEQGPPAQHQHSGLVLASSLRVGCWSTALSAAHDKDYTLAQA